MDNRDCGEIMTPFLRAVAEGPGIPPIQIIGGNGSAALLHKDTIIDVDAATIEAPASCDLPRRRTDHTIRDMDTLVLSSDQAHIDAVDALAKQHIGEALTISIFGLKTSSDLERQQRHPIRSTAWVFLGDRYMDSAWDEHRNLGCGDGHKALYPFKAAASAETLDTFQLSIGDRPSIPTSHPGATILNYLTRSISGLRAKDAEKVQRISQNVLSRYPEVHEWIHDGPGRDTLELARVLHTLREPRDGPRPLCLGEFLQIVPYQLAELVNHPNFMGTHLRPRGQRALVEIAHAKARVLGRFEAKPAIATFWRKHIEERLHRIMHNTA